MKKILAVTSIFIAICACKPKATEQQPSVPVPQTAEVSQAGVSTVPVSAVNELIGMPGAYMKSTVGQVGKAKEAKALYEKAAKQELEGLDPDKLSGN